MVPKQHITNILQEFWTTGGINTIRKITKACKTCIRFSKQSAMPIMGNLLREGVTTTGTFSQVGLDFGGAIYSKVSKTKLDKSYIALFVCMATKAIRIELVSSLTTMACFAALRRFTSRRGLPAAIFSDKGRNFVGARNELSALQDILDRESSSSLASFSGSKGVTWLMILSKSKDFTWLMISPRVKVSRGS